MADEFNGIDTRSEILRIISQVSPISDENGLRRSEAAANMTLRRKRVVHPIGGARVGQTWEGSVSRTDDSGY
jgi:hypothetical protein